MARVEVVTDVAATPEDLWKLIATGEGMSTWFVDSVIAPGSHGSVTLRFGGDGEGTMPIQIWHPPHRFRFGVAEGDEGRSHDITLGTGPAGRRVTVIDDGVPDAEVDATRSGWVDVLARLKAEAETAKYANMDENS